MKPGRKSLIGIEDNALWRNNKNHIRQGVKQGKKCCVTLFPGDFSVCSLIDWYAGLHCQCQLQKIAGNRRAVDNAIPLILNKFLVFTLHAAKIHIGVLLIPVTVIIKHGEKG